MGDRHVAARSRPTGQRENAIYRLASAPLVVRIARSADRLARVEKELCLARCLADGGVPAVRVKEDIAQPLLVDGHPVSFWRSVTGGKPEPTQADLARLLSSFHSLPDCSCNLPTFDPFGPSAARLAKASGVATVDLEFLRALWADLAEQFGDLTFALPVGPIPARRRGRHCLQRAWLVPPKRRPFRLSGREGCRRLPRRPGASLSLRRSSGPAEISHALGTLAC